MFRKKDTDSEGSTGGEGVLRRSGGEGAPTELPPRKVELTGRVRPGGRRRPPAGSLPPGRQAEPDRVWRQAADRRSGHPAFRRDQLLRPAGGRRRGRGDPERHPGPRDCRSGRFTGGCEVEEADISGVYEGDLTVRKRLFVRGSGKLTGTVRYGELELERGGQIAGNISVLDSAASRAGSSSSSESKPAFGGTSLASNG